MTTHRYRQIGKNVYALSNRYYVSVGNKRCSIHAKNDKEGLKAGQQMIKDLAKEYISRRLNKLRERQARELIKLESRLNQRYGLEPT